MIRITIKTVSAKRTAGAVAKEGEVSDYIRHRAMGKQLHDSTDWIRCAKGIIIPVSISMYQNRDQHPTH